LGYLDGFLEMERKNAGSLGLAFAKPDGNKNMVAKPGRVKKSRAFKMVGGAWERKSPYKEGKSQYESYQRTETSTKPGGVRRKF